MKKSTAFFFGLSCLLLGYIIGGIFGGKGGFKQIIGNTINHNHKDCKKEDPDSYDGEDELRKLDGIEDEESEDIDEKF